MSSNEQNEDPKDNELPANDQAEGLTAEQAAEARPYDEMEAWKKSKNTLFAVLGVIALCVAISSFYNNSKQEEATERSLRFVNASVGDVGSEEKFLSFAEDYDDTLGGVAQYRAASIQYGEGRFSESAESFRIAADRLIGDPLAGRARIGHAVSLLKNKKIDMGTTALAAIIKDSNLLNADRYEAMYLLGVHSLTSDDLIGYESQKDALGESEKAADYLSRLVEFERLHTLYKQAKSLPDINLAKGADYLDTQRKRNRVKETESGLLYEVLKDGNGSLPVETDEVEVHYHGTLINGDVFDSSKDRGEPAKFRVNQVIKGWTEALQLMKTGSKWKLYIPAELAYGKRGSNTIGPNEALTFEVELLGITPPLVEPDLPVLNDSEPLPVVFPADSNQSEAPKAQKGKISTKKEANASK